MFTSFISMLLFSLISFHHLFIFSRFFSIKHSCVFKCVGIHYYNIFIEIITFIIRNTSTVPWQFVFLELTLFGLSESQILHILLPWVIGFYYLYIRDIENEGKKQRKENTHISCFSKLVPSVVDQSWQLETPSVCDVGVTTPTAWIITYSLPWCT